MGDNMEETFSLIELLQRLWKRKALIAIITTMAVLSTGLYSYFFVTYTPIYQETSQLLVNQAENDQETKNVDQFQINQQLFSTYLVILKSPVILDQVVKELDLDMTASELKGKITVARETDSQVVNIFVQDTNAKKAAKIANKIADVSQKEIVKTLNVDTFSVLTKAEVAENPTPINSNKTMFNIKFALVIGLMVGAGMALILEYLANMKKTVKVAVN
jgi:capsular polysaccharide biosynthesis protein